MSTILRLVAALIVLVGAFGTVFFLGMRARWSPVLTAVKKMNRNVTNPLQMKKAGTPGAYAGIIRHVGRSSGTPYETPFTPIPADDDFLFMLPYGTSPDWLKNVTAAGSAELVTEGVTYAVDNPRIVDTEAAMPFLSERDQKTANLFNMEDFLLVHNAGTIDA